MKLVLASSNQGKLKELKNLLSDSDIDIYSQSEYGVIDAIENGKSFEENALIKARHCSQQTGLASLADDSGLAVDYLNGAPGIYSARFAGEEATDQQNVDKLLSALAGVDESKRTAHFVCVLAMVEHADDENPIICKGIWHGYIAHQQQGEHGFGYDPVFYVDQHQCTAAMLEAAMKNQMSHRALALKQLKSKLDNPHS